jgi:hypothetical protein
MGMKRFLLDESDVVCGGLLLAGIMILFFCYEKEVGEWIRQLLSALSID